MPLLQCPGILYRATTHIPMTISNSNNSEKMSVHRFPSPTLSMALHLPPSPTSCNEQNSFSTIAMPTTRPSNVPVKVTCPGPKTFNFCIGGKTVTISIDRLKPAHVDLEQPPPVTILRPRGRPPKIPNPSSPSEHQHHPDTPNLP